MNQATSTNQVGAISAHFADDLSVLAAFFEDGHESDCRQDSGGHGRAGGAKNQGDENEPGPLTFFDERQALLNKLSAVVADFEDAQRRKSRVEAEIIRHLAEGEDILYRLAQLDRTTAGKDLASRTVLAEFAAAARVSPSTIAGHMGHASKLVNQYPKVQEALEEGFVTHAHTRVIVDEGLQIQAAEERAEYEKSVLNEATEESVSRLRPIAKQLADRGREPDLEERHRAAKKERRVRIYPTDDGMVDLYAHLPAVEGYAMWDRLSQQAFQLRDLEKCDKRAPEASKESNVSEETSGSEERAGSAQEPRTIDQLRADALIDSILMKDDAALLEQAEQEAEQNHRRYAQSKVQVVIPASILLAMETFDFDTRAAIEAALGPMGSANLTGYGPISEAAARDVAGEAEAWDRVWVDDSSSSSLLTVDRYRPSEEMRRILLVRDQHCRFPGCRLPAIRCDLDHTVDYARGGETSIDNLAFLCRGHHTLKHHGGWDVEQETGGTMRWTSPTGRTYRDRPSSRVFFTPAGSDQGAPFKGAAKTKATKTSTSGTTSSNTDNVANNRADSVEVNPDFKPPSEGPEDANENSPPVQEETVTPLPRSSTSERASDPGETHPRETPSSDEEPPF